MPRYEQRNLWASGVEVSYTTFDPEPDGVLAAWTLQPPNGPNVSVNWNPQEGQWFISILTEEGDVAADDQGCPYLCVTVNDVPVYDHSADQPDTHITSALAWTVMDRALVNNARNERHASAADVCAVGFDLQERIKKGEKI